jgi:dihydroflavonol-4-reductase
MKTTLVTGGTGFVGGAIVRSLHARDEQVRVLARPTSKTEALAQLGVEIVQGDILDQNSVEAALKGCDTLYHAAAIYELWVPDKQLLLQTEIEGTRNVMTAARNCGVNKIVYTSTTFTIGESRGQMGDETTLHRGYFCTAYEEAKFKAELVVQEFAQQGLPVVIVNPGGVIGPGDLKATGQLFIDLLNRKQPMLLPGTATYVYVDDAVNGHLLAAENGLVGQRYILCGLNIDFVELGQKVCALAGVKPPPVGSLTVAKPIAHIGEFVSRLTKRPPLLAKDAIAMLAHGVQADGSKAEHDLGLRYTPLEDGLRAAITWYWEQGLLKQKPKFLA